MDVTTDIIQAQADLASAKAAIKRLEAELQAASRRMLDARDRVCIAQREIDLARPQAVICTQSPHESRMRRDTVCIVRRTNAAIWTKQHGQDDAAVTQWRQRRPTGLWQIYPYSIVHRSWLEVAK